MWGGTSCPAVGLGASLQHHDHCLFHQPWKCLCVSWAVREAEVAAPQVPLSACALWGGGVASAFLV